MDVDASSSVTVIIAPRSENCTLQEVWPQYCWGHLGEFEIPWYFTGRYLKTCVCIYIYIYMFILHIYLYIHKSIYTYTYKV